MSATFQHLTKDNKPTDTDPILVLAEYSKHESRTTTKELLVLIGEPVFTKTLEGDVLTGFRMINGDVIPVTDHRIMGWCPIDTTPPTQE